MGVKKRNEEWSEPSWWDVLEHGLYVPESEQSKAKKNCIDEFIRKHKRGLDGRFKKTLNRE